MFKFSITAKKNEIQNGNTVLPVKEVQVEINNEGGVMVLCVSVSLSDTVKPLSESPSQWTLALPGNQKI